MKDHEAARMAWQAAEAHWRKEFARVTGLGIEATLEETIEHYMDTVNQAVAWRDELAQGREKMKCGHRRANWFHAQSEDEGCCLACQAEWFSLLPCGHVRMNLVDLVSEPDIPSTRICLACKAVKEAHGRELMDCGHPPACGIPCYKTIEDMQVEKVSHYECAWCQSIERVIKQGREPQTAETCQHVPPHPRAYVVEKQICGRCSRPWPCLDHPAILQEQLINIQRVKVCLVCEAVKQARELAICGHPVACGIPCYKTKEDMDANQVSHYECAWCQSITQTMKCNRDATLLEAAKALCNDCSLGRRLNPIWNGARKRVDFFHDDASGDNMTGCDAEAIHRLREGK